MANYEVKYRYTDSVIVPAITEADAEYAFEKDFEPENYPDIEIVSIEEVIE